MTQQTQTTNQSLTEQIGPERMALAACTNYTVQDPLREQAKEGDIVVVSMIRIGGQVAYLTGVVERSTKPRLIVRITEPSREHIHHTFRRSDGRHVGSDSSHWDSHRLYIVTPEMIEALKPILTAQRDDEYRRELKFRVANHLPDDISTLEQIAQLAGIELPKR